jgi:anti-anti-sigma factor
MVKASPGSADVWRLTVKQAAQGEVVELSLRGRLGLSGAAELESALDGVSIETCRRLVLDLADVDYLSSPGLRLIEARARELEERGGAVIVRNATDPVRLALDLAGLERLCASIDDDMSAASAHDQK